MKVKLSYLYRMQKQKKALVMKNFFLIAERVAPLKDDFWLFCDAQGECPVCPYAEYEKEDKCFLHYIEEHDVELDIVE